MSQHMGFEQEHGYQAQYPPPGYEYQPLYDSRLRPPPAQPYILWGVKVAGPPLPWLQFVVAIVSLLVLIPLTIITFTGGGYDEGMGAFALVLGCAVAVLINMLVHQKQ